MGLRLPVSVCDVLEAAEEAGFTVDWKNRQNVTLRSGPFVVGGWNRAAKHWYVSARAVRQAPRRHRTLLQCHDFRPHARTGGSTVRVLSGEDSAHVFRAVFESVTRTRIPSRKASVSADTELILQSMERPHERLDRLERVLHNASGE